MDALEVAGCLTHHGQEEGKQHLLTCYRAGCFIYIMTFEHDRDTLGVVSFLLIDEEAEVQNG